MHVYNMENFGYKFVLMTDIPQTVKAILFATSPVYFVSFSQQQHFYTLLPLPWGKSLFASRFGGFRWPAAIRILSSKRENPGNDVRDVVGRNQVDAPGQRNPKWHRPLTNHSVREITATTFFFLSSKTVCKWLEGTYLTYTVDKMIFKDKGRFCREIQSGTFSRQKRLFVSFFDRLRAACSNRFQGYSAQ